MKEYIKILIKAVIRDNKGKLIKQFRWKRSHSLLCQFAQILAGQMNYTQFNVLDITNTSRAINPDYHPLDLAAANTVTTNGMVIGNDATPVTMTDIKLQVQITTNINYGICSTSVEAVSATEWRALIARTFTNNTGSPLSIEEVGLYSIDANGYKYCIDRTLYPVIVPTGSGITLSYAISISL